MPVLIVIPARFQSSRFPGKPLVELVGATEVSKSLIERSWRAARQVAGVTKVVVATDDDRIAAAARAFGGDVVMTSPNCANGTERCAEALEALGGDFDVVVNFQGDAPLTPPWFVEDIIKALMGDPLVDMATPVLRCDGEALAGFKRDRQQGRVGATTVVFDGQGRALYFSKEVIPFCADIFGPADATPVFHHVGVYAFRPNLLADYRKWKPGPIEEQEGLEQLRILENGGQIACVEVDARGRRFWEINNPGDVATIEAMMRDMGLD